MCYFKNIFKRQYYDMSLRIYDEIYNNFPDFLYVIQWIELGLSGTFMTMLISCCAPSHD